MPPKGRVAAKAKQVAKAKAVTKFARRSVKSLRRCLTPGGISRVLGAVGMGAPQPLRNANLEAIGKLGHRVAAHLVEHRE